MTRGHHDVGGSAAGPIDRQEHTLAFWERRVEAMRDCLGKRRDPIVRTDELRRVMENMEPELYEGLAFYERKAWSLRAILVEKNILNGSDIASRIQEVRQRRDAAIENLPETFDHRHDHEDVKDDDVVISEYDVLSEAMFVLLVEKGVLSTKEVGAMIERMEDAGPAKGARIVAHAWEDLDFKKRLLENGKTAVRELGIESLESEFIVVENTSDKHNILVCTLCSCYPRSILGSPPAWYVSKAYRSRTVKEPRAVLAEFGTDVPPGTTIEVHDSTADARYMVLPMRPEGTAGWREDDLAALVTRDSLIGVGLPRAPTEGGKPS